MERLYGNVGRFIKGVAIASFIVEAIGAIIYGVVAYVDVEEASYLLIAIGGPMIAFVSSAFVYAFGELVEKVCIIEGYMTQDREEAGKLDRTMYNDDLDEERAVERAVNKHKNVKTTAVKVKNKDDQTISQLEEELKTYSAEDLKLILKDQSDLYSDEELKVITAELKKRS